MKKIFKTIFTKSIGLYINILSYVNPKKAIKIAYSLFSEPRDGRLNKEELPSILQEATTETHRLNKDYFQSYTWKGNDTIILLVHGWESNASRWENLIPYLRKFGSTVIALDGPAHGLSSGKEFNIPQYAAFIDLVSKKYPPTYLIGHSLGAKTCLYYQAKYQNSNIKKMVILGSPSDFKVILNNYIKMLSLNTAIYNGLRDHYLNHFELKLDQFSGKHFASQILVPGLIAHDSQDSVVLFAEAEKIAASWKNSVLIETKGLGHSMHDEVLYGKVAQFLFESK
ncbi:alpha/beta hydrolase [Flavobacterium frigidarium]|uniref:alpha/beta hydrolase n=1 Tax=Flavobacterium frigidarium TaxID=99286 RepID=UPI0030D854C5